MKVSFGELPTGLVPGDAPWRAAVDRLSVADPDLVVLNEMPFGPWLAASPRYSAAAAREAIALHEAGLAALSDLGRATVVASRPIAGREVLRNEAFAWRAGDYRALHQKHYFPSEPGFYERSWFERPPTDFAVHDLGAVKVGVLLCTEVMFNEWARHYGRAGAQLILVPRASGTTVRTWQAALAMAAVVSGCYVVSSNRVGVEGEQTFGGRGFVYAPGGELLAATDAEHPIATIAVDPERVRQAQAGWPCDVPELAAARTHR